MTIKCSVLLTAYNEEKNIGELLTVLKNQKLNTVDLAEIIIVASGCTDNTVEIINEHAKINSKIKLFIQEQREGKASAINLAMKNAISPVLVLESTDTLPDENTIERLVTPFHDEKIGVTSTHVLPQNDKNSFIGFYIHLMWDMHHLIALQDFKGGEMIAYRNVIKSIPVDTATDETWIVVLVKDKGYKVKYVSDAYVKNRGPENLKDFIKVRRRHIVGYFHLKKVWPEAQLPETMNNFHVLRILLQHMSWKPKSLIMTIISLLMEVWARSAARYDWYIKNKNPFIWDIAESTKKVDK